jgi:hypothetical protein
MNWDNFDHWRDRQYDMFIWYNGLTLREMEKYLGDAFGEYMTGPDTVRIHLNGEWPEGDIRRMGDRSRI